NVTVHEDTQINENNFRKIILKLTISSQNLVEDFKNLYETKERYDTIITVGKEPNIEQIHAHSVILCTRSSYFRRALSDE
ncbi:6764_t:CDS:2, partial [Gigaspora rosea]